MTKPPTWNRRRYFSVTCYSRLGTSPPTENVYKGQGLSADVRSVTAFSVNSGIRIRGSKGVARTNRFLMPLPYTRGGFRVTTQPYDYFSSANRRNWGSMTPISLSIGPGDQFAYWPLSASMQPPSWINGYNEAITKALSKVSVAKVNYSLAVVEAHKSFETVSRRFVFLVRAISLVRRLRTNSVNLAYRQRNRHTVLTTLSPANYNRGTRLLIRAVRRDRKALRDLGLGIRRDVTSGNILLEYNYGWRPLLSDIFGAAQQLAKGIDAPTSSFYVKASTSRECPDYSKPPNAYHWSYENSLKQGVKVRLDYSLDDQNVQAHKARLLGLDNPFVLAWELIPWSFVVDWALPVGTALSGLTSSFGVKFRAGSYTNWVKGSHQCRYLYNTTWPLNGSPHQVSSEVFAVQRTTLASSPLPRLYIKSPFARLSTEQTLNRLFTAYALLGQVLR